MATKIYHLHLPEHNFHGYYSTLTALYADKGNELSVSMSTLHKFPFVIPWEGEQAIIRRGYLVNTRTLAKRKKMVASPG